jgi:hypothetical protein
VKCAKQGFARIFLGFIVLFLIPEIRSGTSGPIQASDCTFKGKKLYGKIQFVTSFPDVRVRVVSSFPDLKVKHVDSFARRCGEWQIVTSFPDTKIQIVESFPDIKIQYVSSFPGLP